MWVDPRYRGLVGGGVKSSLEKQREAMFAALDKQRGLYQDPLAQQLEAALSGQLSGADSPFTADVVTGLGSQASDAAAAGFESDRDMILRAMANAGVSGSGAQASAMLNAKRRANAANRSARRDIRTRADLENYQARERARASLNSYLSQRASAMQAANLAEANLRSRFEQIGQAGVPGQGGPTNYIPWRDDPGATGNLGGGAGMASMRQAGPSTIIANPMGTGRGVARVGGGGGYAMGAGSGIGALGYAGGQGTPFAVAPTVYLAPDTAGGKPINRTQRFHKNPKQATAPQQHTVNRTATNALQAAQGYGQHAADRSAAAIERARRAAMGLGSLGL